jgi:hypothetical protein
MRASNHRRRSSKPQERPVCSADSDAPLGAVTESTAGELDPTLIPFLDLLAELIARDIVAAAANVEGEKTSAPACPLAPGRPDAAEAAVAGPIPTVPVDSQAPSQAGLTTPHTAPPRSAPMREEFHHASD